MKKFLLLGFYLLFSNLSQAQLYGNEWINFNQDYYKIKIGKEGIYRIDYSTLQSIGFPLSSVNPQYIQLWINGKEQPIIVSGEDDFKFDIGDYIEFYGTYNDGKLDAPLYNAGEQPHQYMSLYSDTATYFLTISASAVGKRVVINNDNNYTGKTADPYFMYEQVVWYKNQAYDGLGFANEGFHSEYSEGEGWAVQFGGSGINVNFITPHISNLGPKPFLELLAHSRGNNVSSYDIDGYNNGLQLSYNPSGTLIEQKRITGLDRYLFQDSLDRSKMGVQNTSFKLTSYLLAKSVHSLAYFKLIYPRKFNLNDSSNLKFNYTSTNNFIKFSNYASSKSKPIIYDINNHTKSLAEIKLGELYCNLSTASLNKLLLVSDETSITSISSTNIKPYKFKELKLISVYDYLIISNQRLDSGARAYQDFLSSSIGGNHNVYMAYTNDIYDQFYYGLKHPQSLQNFCRFSINSSPTLKYLLLLGKGQRYINTRYDANTNNSVDLVPTYGIPPSDYFFTSGYNGSKLDPLLATGRIPATTNKQIAIYLSKLSGQLSQGYQPWKKNILQLAGGDNTTSVNQFTGFLTTYANICSNEKWGASRKLITKQDPSPVDSTLKSKIQKEINSGYALVDYFGHGSTQASDIDLGEAYQLNNVNKYPFYYFNGCGLGNTFDGTSIAEGFLFTPNKGAIGWLASTTFGFVSELNFYALLFHQKLTENPTVSFADNLARTIKEYQSPGNDYNRGTCKQMLFMGDPSVRIFDATLPDYTVDDSKSNIFPKKATADLDSFAIVIHLQNLALFSKDSFTINVRQTLPNGTNVYHKSKRLNPFGTMDTVFFWIKKKPGINIKGTNIFTITIDSSNTVAEQLPLGESNNVSLFTYTFTSVNAQILFPRKDGILNSTTAKLVAQSLIYTRNNFNFIFEIDTIPSFNSPYKKTSGIISSQYIAQANFSLLPIDSLDYYWRVKIDDGTGASFWDESTFSMIYNSPEGWSQGYIDKFVNSSRKQLNYDTLKNLEFLTAPSNNYQIWAGGKYCNQDYFFTIWHEGPPLWTGYYKTNGICAVAINPFTERRFQTGSKFNRKSGGTWTWFEPMLTDKNRDYYIPAGIAYSGAHTFSMVDKTIRDSFVTYLKRIPFGYHIMLFSGTNTNVENWEEEIFTELEKFGALKIRTLKNNYPYILVGQKGKSPGDAEEKLADYSLSIAPENQCISLNTTLSVLADSGQMSSSRIGPAKTWKYFYRTLNKPDNSNDKVKFNIYGVSKTNNETLLFNGVTDREINLRGIDAKTFPYLRIEADIEDSITKTPTGISRWTVLFDGYPEGLINPPVSLYQNKDTLEEGDTLVVKIAYSNISNYDMDSVLILTTSINDQNTKDTIELKKYKVLKSDDSIIIIRKIYTKGLSGFNVLTVSVNPEMAQPEEYLFNNTWQFPYYIKNDHRNPYLDVVFDGRHITNLEIVSPNPQITITAVDENKFFYLDRADYFKVKLKEPWNATFRELNVTSDTFVFVPSKGPNDKCKLVFNPINLKDGIYVLSISVMDAKGNFASDEDYKISFRVITKSTLTNIYPYPNPFTTKTKFVFTLTGDKVPEYFKISVISVSGTVVKEITLDDLGSINIGNNITKYEWDGTDTYGDKLANGVYLYKVTAKLNGKDIELSETAGDTYFKKGYGKLYIMR